MVNPKSKGVNWVEHLLDYMRVLAREEVGSRSRFEIYYGRISNSIKNNNIEEDSIIHQQDMDFRLPVSSAIWKH